MANTYNYQITDMQRDENGIVISVNFNVTAFDDVDSYTHTYQTALLPSDGNPIPFENLTQNQVIDWVKNLIQLNVEEQADFELDAYKLRKNQTLSNGTPW